MSLFVELKRRNVFRVAAAYVITGWLLVQVLELAADSFEAPVWVMKMIITIIVIGFIPTLLFSWAFELTPEGVKRERDVDRGDSITTHTGRKLDYITLAAAIGVAALFVWQQVAPPRSDAIPAQIGTSAGAIQEAGESGPDSGSTLVTPPISVNSIAVLPFVNMSADQDNEYFSDGISEELLNMLVRVEGLQVASRTSAFSFKGKNVDIPTMAEALRVNHIVEGSVRRAGDQVRITAQLIDVQSDKHLWSDSYTRELKDVFAIQDEIATAIAAALELTLLSDQHRHTDDLEAYDLYLLGRHHFHQRTPVSLPKAIELFEQVIELDPQFAPAYSGLADAYSLVFQYGDFDFEVAIAKAATNAAKAVELDPLLAEAHASMGLNLAQQGNLAKARESYRRAIELNPDYSMAYMWLGNTLFDQPLEALSAFRAAEQLDPLHPLIAENIGDALRRLGRFDEGAEHLRRAIEVSPETVVLYYTLATLEFDRGDFATAYRVAREAVAVDPTSPYALGALMWAETDLGNFESAESWLRRIEAVAPNNRHVKEGWFSLHEARGDLDSALRVALDNREAAAGFARYHTALDLAAIHLRRGEYEQARLFSTPLLEHEVPFFRLAANGFQAYASYKTGQFEQASAQAQVGLDIIGELRQAGFNQPWLVEGEAIMLALLDRDDEAVAREKVAADQGQRNIHGYSWLWMLDELLGDDDRYLAIKQSIYDDVARQRAQIAAEKDACLEQLASCALADIDDVM